MSEIRDPEVAIAAAKCWLARWGGSVLDHIPVAAHHPRPCGFCEYPSDKLIDLVAEFMAWADPPTPMGEPSALRPELEAFLALSQRQQRRLVNKAQGYLKNVDGAD